MYRHIVLFKIHPEVTAEQISNAKQMLSRLGEQPYIKEWKVESSLDTRKGLIIIQNGLFTSGDSFNSYKKLEIHKEVGEYMSKIADWVVGDYEE